MHSIIVSCINDEPLFTAEQVSGPARKHGDGVNRGLCLSGRFRMLTTNSHILVEASLFPVFHNCNICKFTEKSDFLALQISGNVMMSLF